MRRQPDPYTGPTCFGVDVSKWQGTVDWARVPEDRVTFAISRTGDGKTRDEMFNENWRKSSSFSRGSYHYFRADRDGKFQAELVLDMLNQAGGMTAKDLPPAIDIEGGAVKNLPGGVIAGTKDLPMGLVVEECLEFLDVIESQLKITPLVYTGQAFHWWLSQARPELAEEFAKYPLWTPDYRAVPRVPADARGAKFPWSHWTIWQYTNRERVPGIATPVDGNYFRGTREEYQKFVASLRHEPVSLVPPTPTDATPEHLRQVLESKRDQLIHSLAKVQYEIESL